MKKLLIIVGAIVVLVIALLVVVYTNLGSIIKHAVEKFGSDATQAHVTLSSADVSAASGKASLNGLVVGNPKGYETPSAFELGEISVTMDTSSLSTDTIIVNSVVIAGPKVTYELGSGLKSNLQAIQDNVAEYGKTADSGASSGGGGGGSGAKPDAKQGGGKKFVVKDLVIKGGRVQLSASLAKGGSVGADLPEIHLTDIGSGGKGVSAEQLTAKIIGAITDGALQAVIHNKLVDTAKGLVDSAVDGIKGLLPGGKKK